MTTLFVNMQTGYGVCKVPDGTQYSVIRTEGVWSLGVQHPCSWSFWAKENVKRLSTLQRYANSHGYDITIQEVQGI